MQRMLPWWGGLAAVVVALTLGACSNDAAAPVAKTDGSSHTVTAGRPARPSQLLTHCGIDEARIGGRYF
jgi:hypothetical protein